MLTNRRFGTTGWWAFLTRSVHCSAMVLVVVPVSVLAQIATGPGLANALAAVALSIVGIVLVPYLAGSSPHVPLARFCWAVLGLCLMGSALLVTATGTTSDGWMSLLVCPYWRRRTLDRSTPHADGGGGARMRRTRDPGTAGRSAG